MDFGTLSLEQVRAIDRAGDAFEAAWRGGGRPRIEEALVGVDAGARPALFDVLLGVELECRRRRGEPVSAGEYLSRFPDRAATVEAAFAEARTAQPDPHLDPDAETASWGEIPPPPPQFPHGSVGRYRLIREHGKGGLGIVFLAVDDGLNREVALKEVRPDRSADLDSRARFLLEAEITGRLEHPGIIPVHDLGRHDDGRPYYVMRFIRGAEGKDLAEAIKRLHDAGGESSGSGSGSGLAGRLPGVRALLSRYVGLCNAIGYAHSRKVIHRDIKPSNVLLGPFGETLVIDWGLAKTVDRPGATPTAAEGTLHAAADSATPTQRGTAAGTPGYMSPEQADGDVDRLGPASDIFLLGATLHYLLTGAPPYPGGRDSALARARAWDFRRPREADPTIPRPLESICLKAMARLPEGRYASATDLARDVERWLADEPVSAHRESRGERLSRWGRRHRAWVRAAGLAMVAVTAVSVASALLIDGARRRESAASARERAARVEATAQRDRADANYRRALGSIGEIHFMANETLASIPGAEAYRERLAVKALDLYRALLGQDRDDPDTRLMTARAHRLVGKIRRAWNQLARADGDHRRMVELLDGLVAESPADRSYRDQLAEALFEWGYTLQVWNRPLDGEPLARRSLDEATRLVREAPGEADYQKTEARSLIILAACLVQTGRAHEAVNLSERAVRRLAPIADAPDAGWPIRLEYAGALLGLGEALREDVRYEDAKTAIRDALGRASGLRDASSNHNDRRHVLAEARAQMARSLAVDARQRDVALRALRASSDAIVEFSALARDFPRHSSYRRALAVVRDDRAALLLGLSRLDEADEDLKAARRLLADLRDEAPDSTAHEGPLARVAAHRARLALARGDRAGAIGLYEEAAACHKASLTTNPRSPADLAGAALTRGELARLARGE